MSAFRRSGFPIPVLFAVVLSVLFLFPACTPSTPAQVLRVGFYENSPKIYTTPDGTRTGFFVDILDAIAAAERWEIIHVDCVWTECLAMLERGEIDLMPDVAFSAERAALYDFHAVAVANSWSQIYGPRGLALQTLADLDGLRLAFLDGSVQIANLSALMAVDGHAFRPLTYPSFDAAFAAVATGEADAVVSNHFFALRNATRYGLVETPLLFQPTSLFFAAPDGRQSGVLNTIDAALAAWKGDPDSPYYDAMRRHVADPITAGLPGWVVQAGAAAAGLVALLGVMAAVLRRQVRRRTRDLERTTAALEAERANLERQVAARTAELREAKDAAETLAQVKSDFISTMSHEIRNPMNAILGFVSLAQDSNLPARSLDYLRKAEQAADGLLHVINDVLDMARIESGRLTLDAVEFDLGAVLQQAADVSLMRDRDGAVMLWIDHPLSLPLILRGDPYRLGQVLTNLIGNAIKFTPAGTIRLGVALRQRDGDSVLLEFQVADTGIGMTDAAAARLFQRFAQAEDSTSRRFGGSGLGLAICRDLVAMMDGAIWIERSAPGAGTDVRFTAALTVATTAEAARSAALAAEGAALSGRRATVIGENREEVAAIAALLAESGMQASTAAPDPAALGAGGDLAVIALARTAAPDVVATAQARFGEVLVLHQTPAAAAAAQAAGGRAIHLVRPVMPRALLSAAATALATAASGPAAAPVPPGEAPAASGLRVLLADDNPLNREVGKAMLVRQGMLVDLAEDGQEALTLALRNRYDMILMDLQMPVMDGFAALAAIRAQAGTADHAHLARTPVVAMTASVTPDDIRRAQEAGFAAHVGKPFRVNQLREVLARLGLGSA